MAKRNRFLGSCSRYGRPNRHTLRSRFRPPAPTGNQLCIRRVAGASLERKLPPLTIGSEHPHHNAPPESLNDEHAVIAGELFRAESPCRSDQARRGAGQIERDGSETQPIGGEDHKHQRRCDGSKHAPRPWAGSEREARGKEKQHGPERSELKNASVSFTVTQLPIGADWNLLREIVGSGSRGQRDVHSDNPRSVWSGLLHPSRCVEAKSCSSLDQRTMPQPPSQVAVRRSGLSLKVRQSLPHAVGLHRRPRADYQARDGTHRDRPEGVPAPRSIVVPGCNPKSDGNSDQHSDHPPAQSADGPLGRRDRHRVTFE